MLPSPRSCQNYKSKGLLRSFLWNGGNNGGGKNFALVSWKTIKLPRKEGGLQIRDLKAQNLAIGAKLLWNMLDSKPSWCSKVLKTKYLPGLRLRCLEGEQLKAKGSSIYRLCKKILPHFIEKLHWIPGNGKEIKIWQDSIQGKPPPRLPRLQQWMEDRGMSTLWSISEWEQNNPQRWSAWALPNCPAALEEEKSQLISHLAGIAPVSTKQRDRRGWGTRTGSYMTAEGYAEYATNYNVPMNPEIWNKIWNNSTLPKIEVFNWTLIHQRLLTGENLEKRGIEGPFCCPLYAVNSETISHLFLKCPYAISIWKEVTQIGGDGQQWAESIQDLFINWENRY